MKKFIQYLQMISEIYTVEEKDFIVQNDIILKLRDSYISSKNILNELAKNLNDPDLNASLKFNPKNVTMSFPEVAKKANFPKGIYIYFRDNDRFEVAINDPKYKI